MAKSVFYDLYDDPKKAAVLDAKADLSIELEQLIIKSDLNYQEVATILGTQRPRVSQLMNGHIDRISLDTLTGWLAVLSEGRKKVGVITKPVSANKESSLAAA
ncbi:MAG: XRE family transcriptional regulator [Pseudohongiellaceae bacterium]